MADPRGYFKLANNFPGHPKVTDAGGDAGWLHVCAMGYCSQLMTDGFIPFNMIGRISDRENPQQLASKLLEVGLWHVTGHTCLRCPEVPPNRYLIHDYLEHQTSAEQAKETSRKRAVAGQRGGVAKAAAAQSAQKPDDVDANDASNLLEAGQAPVSSKSLPELEVEVEVEELPNTSVNGAAVDHVKSADAAEQKPQRRRGNARPIDDENFIRFWKLYPRKVSKGAAERAWRKAITYTDPSVILTAVEFHVMECKLKDPQYIPHAATWLNGRRWEDEPDPTYNALLVPSEAADVQPKSYAEQMADIERKIGLGL